MLRIFLNLNQAITELTQLRFLITNQLMRLNRALIKRLPTELTLHLNMELIMLLLFIFVIEHPTDFTFDSVPSAVGLV